MSAVDILKATQQGTFPVRCRFVYGAYWRKLANAIEPSVCASDAALCQITLTAYSIFKITAAGILSDGVHRVHLSVILPNFVATS